MTAMPIIDPGLPWAEQIDRAEPDLLRALLKTFVEALMGAEVDAVCGAPYGVRDAYASMSATATGAGSGTPAPAPSTSRSRSCVPGPTSRTGCSSGAAVPSGR